VTTVFAALHESAFGTSRTCGDVRYLVASGGKADKASDGRTIAIYAYVPSKKTGRRSAPPVAPRRNEAHAE
jgi:hypothetical protein